MQPLKCPDQEKLLEFLTIPKELSLFQRSFVRLHLFKCEGCQSKLSQLRRTWDEYFTPEPEITSSLMRVYSRLQKDETLILKGWKLNESAQSNRGVNHLLLKGGWLFRGTVSVGLAAVVMVVIFTQNSRTKVEANQGFGHTPLAQIRLEEKNGVRVHYLQPELLQTIEFETTRTR